jgi:hypothetical protein
MTDERATTDEPAAIDDRVEQRPPQPPLIDGPLAEHDPWPEEAEELPPRPRRRVLKPLPLALLGALAIACGFIGGVLVEKGQSGSASGAGAGGGFASRLAALGRGASAGSGSGSASQSSGSGTGSESGPSAGTASGPGAGTSGRVGGGSTTVGQVAYVSKGTLYVTTSEGNTVKVTAADGASVTKTAKASIKAIHPGETVLIAGTSGASGAISASSIRIGSLAGALTGGSAFAGVAGASRGGTSSSSGTGAGASGTGEPQLFGKG